MKADPKHPRAGRTAQWVTRGIAPRTKIWRVVAQPETRRFQETREQQGKLCGVVPGEKRDREMQANTQDTWLCPRHQTSVVPRDPQHSPLRNTRVSRATYSEL